jgi:MFS transporter, UMF1 family
MKKNIASQIFSWAMFDFANTSFTVIILTVVFPLYFRNEIVDIDSFSIFGLTLRNPADLFWGIGTSFSFLIVALTAPLLGALSDLSSRKKKYIFYYSLLCIFSIIGIFFLESGDIFLAIALLTLGNIGFETGIIFYDAFLPVLASKDKYSLYSGYGFAAGYLGAIISLLLAFYFQSIDKITYVFPASAIFFLLSSLPFFLFLKEEKKKRISNFSSAVKKSVERVKHTIKRFGEFPYIRQFIMSYFFYINGVLTVITFGGVYAAGTLKFSMNEVLIFFGIVQFSALIGSLVFGNLGKLIGDYKAIMITLFLWICVCLLSFWAAFSEDAKIIFYFAGVIAGISLGSSQSLSRSYYSRMIPENHEAEFFGFFALCGRFAAILGPLLFGIVSSVTGQQSFAILSVLIFFIIGLYTLKSVPKLLKEHGLSEI